ncbi:MAG: Hsp20/alpha crystallin family protein [Erysipelotrichaceae bacterium]|nr:Hsp20/alpha crystallin family protein [Erysipelotrichaceae bacterium]
MLAPRLFTEDLFNDFFKGFPDVERKLYGKHANREMLTDIKEHEDHYDVLIDLPGFKKEDISIELENGYLNITAAKGLREDEENKSGKLIRQERYYGTMSRGFYVGDNIGNEDIKAKYEGGVLSIAVPKKEVTKQIENNRIMIE